MQMSDDLVSVCIPVYNGAAFIEEALDSLKAQTYKHLEIIISDDQSKDNSLEIITKSLANSEFPYTIYNHTPQGIGANWNHTIEKANGTFIKFLFQDDILEPTCIAEMVAAFSMDKNIGLVASKRTFIVDSDSDMDVINKWLVVFSDLQKNLGLSNGKYLMLDKTLFKSPLFTLSPKNKIGEPTVVMFRKSIVNEIGYFSTSLEQILDYEYWYRILKKKKICIINEPLVKFRIHKNQATNVNRTKDISDYEQYDKILFKHYFFLLHPEIRKKLFYRQTAFGYFLLRVRNKIKLMLGK